MRESRKPKITFFLIRLKRSCPQLDKNVTQNENLNETQSPPIDTYESDDSDTYTNDFDSDSDNIISQLPYNSNINDTIESDSDPNMRESYAQSSQDSRSNARGSKREGLRYLKRVNYSS